ncbi:MAG: sporulation integral membrane protein YtvI [Oscillospiraceae bacterium]|nr:sporulation integral membrane protein YtvI [Oscillospiraceae bacterium]
MNIRVSRGVGYALGTAAAVFGLWAGVRFLLPLLLPFLLAFGCAAALEPIVKYLCARARLPRSASSALCLAAALVLLGGGLYLGARRLVYEASALGDEVPMFFESAAATAKRWQIILTRYADSVPEGLEGYVEKAGRSLASTLESAPAYLSGKALDTLGSAAAAAPTALLFAISFVIGIYFISSSYPAITDFLSRQIPPARLEKVKLVLRGLRGSVGRWFRAQLIMMLIMFFALSIAFAMLRIRYSLLMGLITAVVDALPVFGAGTILLPWAAYMLLVGETAVGVGLAVTYGAVALLRGLIQAKLLGDQLGLHPLVTLIAIYAGYKVWGLIGMIVFPIAAISAKQLNDAGLVKIWKKAEG